MAGTAIAPGVEDYSNVVVSGFPFSGQQNLYHGIDKLVEALAEAQSEFSPLLKDTENPYFKSKYADLAAVIKATLPALNKHGLTVIQLNGTDFLNKAATVNTILVHKSGQRIDSFVSIPTGQKFDAQSLGAAWTYGRRYAYQAIIGVAADIDDDGNSIATGFDDTPKPAKYVPKPGKYSGNAGFPVKSENLGSPESGLPKAQIPDGTVFPVTTKTITVNTNANFPADHEPTKEEKDQFKKIARDYVQTYLPGVGIENPAETLKTFVEKLTGQSDTKKLTFNQWTLTLETLKQAVTEGKLKEVVEG